MSNRTTTIATITGLTLVGGLVAYAVYFDHKRRTDIEFRKQLRKEKKRVEKTAAKESANFASASTTSLSEHSANDLREALKMIKASPTIEGAEEREQYFMQQISIGEQLSLQGPMYTLPAALSFFRALRVYPSPVELIQIYQSTVAPPVFNLIMELMNLDVSPDFESPAPAGASPEDEEEVNPARGSPAPPSETSDSQEWDKVTDPSGTRTPAT